MYSKSVAASFNKIMYETLVFLVYASLLGLVGWAAWTYVMVPVFGLPELSFVQVVIAQLGIRTLFPNKDGKIINQYFFTNKEDEK